MKLLIASLLLLFSNSMALANQLEFEQDSAFMLDFSAKGYSAYAYDFKKEGDQLTLWGFEFGNGNPMWPYKVKSEDMSRVVFSSDLVRLGLFIKRDTELVYSVGAIHSESKNYLWSEDYSRVEQYADGRVVDRTYSNTFNGSILDSNLVPRFGKTSTFKVKVQNEDGILESHHVIGANLNYIVTIEAKVRLDDIYFGDFELEDEDYKVYRVNDRRIEYRGGAKGLKAKLASLDNEIVSALAKLETSKLKCQKLVE